jgi:hypothetical protein
MSRNAPSSNASHAGSGCSRQLARLLDAPLTSRNTAEDMTKNVYQAVQGSRASLASSGSDWEVAVRLTQASHLQMRAC